LPWKEWEIDLIIESTGVLPAKKGIQAFNWREEGSDHRPREKTMMAPCCWRESP